MEIIATIFSALFIGLIIATALTFSFALLIWIIAIAVILGAAIMLRETVRRWWFIHTHRVKKEPPTQKIIEGEYKDISED